MSVALPSQFVVDGLAQVLLLCAGNDTVFGMHGKSAISVVRHSSAGLLHKEAEHFSDVALK